MSSSSSRDVALRLGWALMEALAIAAVAVTVTATLPSGGPRLSPAPLLVLMGSATLVGSASARLRARPALARVLALVVTLLLGFAWVRFAAPAPSRGALTGLALLALGVAGRGLMLGLHEPAQADVMRAFLRGAAVLMLLFALLSLAGVPVDEALGTQLRAVVLGYFALGPMAVALAQRRSLGRARGVRAPLTPSWLLSVLLPIVGALVLASIASAGKQGLRDGLAVVTHATGAIVGLTARALAWAGYAGVYVLTQLARLFPGGGSRKELPPLPPAQAPSDAPLVSTGPPLAVTVTQHDVASAVLLATMVLFATLYVSRLLRATDGPNDPFDVDEERASLWSWRLLARQARELLRALLSQARTVGRDAFTRDASFRAPADLSDIRGVYRALLRWAALRGRPRTPATTPHELAAQIVCDEAERAHVDAITELYTEARYGERAVSPAHLDDARAHLGTLTDATAARETDRAPTRR